MNHRIISNNGNSNNRFFILIIFCFYFEIIGAFLIMKQKYSDMEKIKLRRN